MVKIIEPESEWLEFEGRVLSVEKIYSEDFDIERYHIQIEPVDKEWKTQHIWIPISRRSTEDRVLKGTALAEIIKRLDRMGIRGNNASDTIKKMIDKKFVFKKEKIGQCKKEIWCPKSLVKEEKKSPKLVKNPLKG